MLLQPRPSPRSPPATCRPRCPTSTRPPRGTGRCTCRSPRSPSTGARSCWPPGWPTTRWPRRAPRSVTSSRPGPVHGTGRAAADGGQLRAGRGAAAGRAGLGADRAAPVPVAAERLVAGPHGGRCWCRPVRGAVRRRPRLLRAGGAGGRPAGGARLRRGGPAHLLAGRVALDLGRRQDADRHLLAAARSRRRGPALTRASGWLSEALRAEAAADSRRMFAACHRGLGVLDEHQVALGASELRAQATAHGSELATLAQRHAARARRPRLLLAWSERWRATALAVPAVRPPADAELNAGLTALRDVSRRLDKARQGAATPAAAAGAAAAGARAASAGAGGAQLRPAHQGHCAGQPGPRSASPGCSTGWARPSWSRSWTSTALLQVLVCGAGRVRQFTAGRAEAPTTAASISRGSRCAAWPAAGRVTTWAARRPS